MLALKYCRWLGLSILICSVAVWLTFAERAGAGRAPAVEVVAIGKRAVLVEPTTVVASKTKVAAAGRSCSVAPATPLAALLKAATVGKVRVGVRDYGSCSSKVADSTSLFVNRIGGDINRGRDGWVYKVGRRLGTTSASDLSGALGDGKRLAVGSKLTWFYCKLAAAGSCQPTLELLPDKAVVQLGQQITVTVRAYDDRGRGGKPVAGANIRACAGPLTGRPLSSCSKLVVTGQDGKASTPPLGGPGPIRLVAERSGYVAGISAPIEVCTGEQPCTF